MQLKSIILFCELILGKGSFLSCRPQLSFWILCAHGEKERHGDVGEVHPVFNFS